MGNSEDHTEKTKLKPEEMTVAGREPSIVIAFT